MATRSNRKTPSNRARKIIRILGRLKYLFNLNFNKGKAEKKEIFLSELLNLDCWSTTHKIINNIIYKKDEDGKSSIKPGIANELKSGIDFACQHVIKTKMTLETYIQLRRAVFTRLIF